MELCAVLALHTQGLVCLARVVGAERRSNGYLARMAIWPISQFDRRYCILDLSSPCIGISCRQQRLGCMASPSRKEKRGTNHL